MIQNKNTPLISSYYRERTSGEITITFYLENRSGAPQYKLSGINSENVHLQYLEGKNIAIGLEDVEKKIKEMLAHLPDTLENPKDLRALVIAARYQNRATLLYS